MKEKRISFGSNEAGHLYELAMEHMCQQWESCGSCSYLRERLDKFLGKKEVNAIKRILRRNGYCSKLKSKQKINGK